VAQSDIWIVQILYSWIDGKGAGKVRKGQKEMGRPGAWREGEEGKERGSGYGRG